MKTIRSILSLLTAAALLCAGCTSTQDATIATDLAKVSTTARQVANVATLVPAAYKAKLVASVKAYIAAHPGTYVNALEATANGLESLAADGKELPDPNGAVFSTLTLIAGNIPGAGPLITDVVSVYREAFPYIHGGAPALTELGEIIRSFEPVKAGA